ncbi:MAG: MBL fold metallo-hydrolase, partial [Candidatus Kerfeldbacteria bacterium]|nr:MBL fold metallo-hydrolase [Candidatus Kerfeldbacteria bacterium]
MARAAVRDLYVSGTASAVAAMSLPSTLRRHRLAFVTGLAAFAIAAVGLWPAERGFSLTFFDVGQGDGMHLRSESFDLIVDGGPSPRFVHQVASRLPATDRTLELVVLTHPDFDHLRGLLSLFDR